MNSGPYETTSRDLTVDTTCPLLIRACRIASLDHRNVRVLRHHSNAVLFVGPPAHEVVIKIGRPGLDPGQDLRDAQSLVELVQCLTVQKVPITSLLDTVPRPLSIDGHVVTLWRYLPQTAPMPTDAIAAPLRALHEAPAAPISHPALDPYTAIMRSLTVSRISHVHGLGSSTHRERAAPGAR